MNISKLKIGTRLEFELISETLGETGYSYISQVLDIRDESNLIIAAPIREGRLVFIPLQAKIKILFLHDVHGLLSFIGTVIDKGKIDNVMVLFVQVDGEFKKIQRRKNFRLSCSIDATYHPYTGENSDDLKNCKDAQITLKKAFAKNISASGACIVTNEQITEGSLIKVTLFLGEELTVTTTCKVMRNTKTRTGKVEKFEAGLNFLDLSRINEDRITRFIFDLQRKLLKNNIMGK